jgi:DNA recombination protein RmuC
MVGAILIVLVLLALAGACAIWIPRLFASFQAQLAERNAEFDRRLENVGARVDHRLADLDAKVDRRLESAQRTSSDIHDRLGKQAEATAQMLEQAKGLSRLEQVLRPPKARGGFGELLLENLLRDRLPKTAYDMQYTFRSGERVDAVIKVDKLVPIDAKFPLDNFERMVEADGEDERELYEKAFGRDVRQHIDAIAAKYIRPGEGTYEFALMYLPAEGIYYELMCGKTGALLRYAHDKRVFPVSPTTFTAQLQVIALGLKGLQIEQNAQEVMSYCAELQKDFAAFKKDFETLGTHLTHARGKYDEADKRLNRFDAKLEQAVEQGAPEIVLETSELPRAVDAA